MAGTTDGATPLAIAVIGTGNIGGTLGGKFAAAGHQVTFGSRHPDPDDPNSADVVTALTGADVIVLALPGNAAGPFAHEHAASLAGALVVDATNSIAGPGPAHSKAAITAAVPSVRYVRAFNTLGWENFADPRFGDETADLFFSAPEGDRATIEALIMAVGLRPVFLGDGQEDVVDGVLRLWFTLVAGQGHNRRLAFRVLEDPR